MHNPTLLWGQQWIDSLSCSLSWADHPQSMRCRLVAGGRNAVFESVLRGGLGDEYFSSTIFEKMELNVWGSIFLNNMTSHWEHYCHSITYGSSIWYIMLPCHRYNSLCDFFGLFIPTTVSCAKIMITVFLLFCARTYVPWILAKLFSCYVLPIFVKQGSFSLVTFKVPTQLMSTDFKMC